MKRQGQVQNSFGPERENDKSKDRITQWIIHNLSSSI